MQIRNVAKNIGADESHSIHKIRATTVILEEDGSLQDATSVNVVLPNKPHATALQVEEVGSYKLERNEQSVSYQLLDDGAENKTRIYTQGIVDEIDSDTDHMARHASVTTSRNVSINSVSEDEGSVGTGTQVKRELFVDEQTKNVELDDGYAEIKVKRIVLQEEETTTAEIHEADEGRFDIGESKKGVTKDLQRELDEKKSQGRRASVEDARDVANDADDSAQKARVNRQSSQNNDKARKGSLYDIEEKTEHADLSPEEAKQLRIKEIRAKARRASVLSKEPKTDSNLLDDDESATASKAAIRDVGDDADNAQRGKLFDKRGSVADEDGVKSTGKQAKDETIEPSAKLQNGSESTRDDDDAASGDRDEYLENLLKRAQRQRSAVDELEETKSADVTDRAASPVAKRGLQADVEEATPVEAKPSKQSVDSAGIRSVIFMDFSFVYAAFCRSVDELTRKKEPKKPLFTHEHIHNTHISSVPCDFPLAETYFINILNIF